VGGLLDVAVRGPASQAALSVARMLEPGDTFTAETYTAGSPRPPREAILGCYTVDVELAGVCRTGSAWRQANLDPRLD